MIPCISLHEADAAGTAAQEALEADERESLGWDPLPWESATHGKGVRPTLTWFGIVRKTATEGKDEDATRTLLVENKYFDGLTDTHILALSFNGGGDFTVQVGKSEEKIDPLLLVRVYGKVVEEKEDRPVVEAEYVRVWPWTTFTFIKAYGEDHLNPEWRKLCTVDLERIHRPLPDVKYYVDRLGPLPKN